MNKRYIEQKINHYRNIKDNIWTALIVTIGGSAGLSINLDSKYKSGLLIVGVIFAIILIFGYFNNFDNINNLLNKLKEGDNDE